MTKKKVHIPAAVLSEKEAAAYLKMSYSSLARLRRRGTGPPWTRSDGHRGYTYRIDVLDEYLREHTRK